MNIKPEEIYTIDNEEYVSMNTFAKAINRHKKAVQRLVHIGNSYRKLKAKFIENKPMILLSEIYDFPFTTTGPGEKENRMYHNKLTDGDKK